MPTMFGALGSAFQWATQKLPFKRTAISSPALPWTGDIDYLQDRIKNIEEKLINDLVALPYRYPDDQTLTRDPGLTYQLLSDIWNAYLSIAPVSSAIDGLVDSIVGLEISVIPDDKDDPKEQKAAEFVQWSIEKCKGGWDKTLTQILTPALVLGFSVSEIVKWRVPFHKKWEGYDTLFEVKSKDVLDYIRFRTDVYRNITDVVNTVRGLEYVDPRDTVIFTFNDLFGNPYGRSALRQAIVQAKLYQEIWDIWYLGMKIWSGPIMFGKLDSRNKGLMSTFENILKMIRAGAYGIFPISGPDDKTDIELMNPSSTFNFTAMKDFLDKVEQVVYMAVRGAYLPFMQGNKGQGSGEARGNSETSKNSGSDPREYHITKSLCRVAQEQLFPVLVHPNFGWNVSTPTLQLGGVNWNDTSKIIDSVTKYQQAGGKAGQKWFAKATQIPPPEDKADELKPVSQAQQGGMPSMGSSHPQQSSPDDLFSQSSSPGAEFPLAAVACVYTPDKKKVLLGLSTADDERNGKWCFPGGGIEDQDRLNVRAAAVRECWEEMHIRCTPSNKPLILPQKSHAAFVPCIAEEQAPQVNHEFTEARWFPISELSSLELGPNTMLILLKILGKDSFAEWHQTTLKDGTSGYESEGGLRRKNLPKDKENGPNDKQNPEHWDGSIDEENIEHKSNWDRDDFDEIYMGQHKERTKVDIQLVTAGYDPNPDDQNSQIEKIYRWESRDAATGDLIDKGDWNTDKREVVSEAKRYAQENHEDKEDEQEEEVEHEEIEKSDEWPTKAKSIKIVPMKNESRDDVEKKWSSIMGGDIPLAAAASLIGAPENSDVEVYLSNKGDVVIEAKHPDIEDCTRILKYDSINKVPYIYNSMFVINEKARENGFGSRIIGDQIDACRAAGIQEMRCHAARVDSEGDRNAFTGYIVWPLIGYDQSLTDSKGILNNQRDIYESARTKFPEAKTVRDVIESPGGREWWKENGGDMLNAVFDLRGESRSMEIWNARKAKKASK